jgi:GAF domain-containing protein
LVNAEGIGALAFIPLTANGQLIGKFMTYYAVPHEFSPAEIELAVTIARQLGFALGATMPDLLPYSLPSFQTFLSSTIYPIGRNQLVKPSHPATLNCHRARCSDGAPPTTTSCIAALPTPVVGAWGIVVMAGICKPLHFQTWGLAAK